MHSHMQICKCIFILSLVITITDSEAVLYKLVILRVPVAVLKLFACVWQSKSHFHTVVAVGQR